MKKQDEYEPVQETELIIHHRTQAEHDAIRLAMEHGNRKQRREFRFGSKTANERDGKDAGAVDITRAERDRRNAKRRMAKKTRRTNR